ncbi:hypothetical protein C8J56DRAFT_892402 [Mycena floridula]|nr:hypothetical protein C8J56DRAFT_892402 [Mycena floridula]
MSIPAQILDPSQWCRCRADYAAFKEAFFLALQSYGLDKIVDGTMKEPTSEPVAATVVEVVDSNGVVTSRTTTTRPVISAALGSDELTKADYKVRNYRISWD